MLFVAHRKECNVENVIAKLHRNLGAHYVNVQQFDPRPNEWESEKKITYKSIEIDWKYYCCNVAPKAIPCSRQQINKISVRRRRRKDPREAQKENTLTANIPNNSTEIHTLKYFYDAYALCWFCVIFFSLAHNSQNMKRFLWLPHFCQTNIFLVSFHISLLVTFQRKPATRSPSRWRLNRIVIDELESSMQKNKHNLIRRRNK